MFAVVGLGNPGASYADTRHNVGFWVADELSKRWGGVGHWQAKLGCEFQKCTVSGSQEQVILVKPQKFMNLSGEACAPLLRFFKIPVEQLIVIHDEVALEVGRLQVRQGGGAAGHHGVEDIIAHIGGENFYRIRVGIGHPRDLHPSQNDVSSWVLARPGPEEKELLEDAVFAAANAMEVLIAKGLDTAQQKFNQKIR